MLCAGLRKATAPQPFLRTVVPLPDIVFSGVIGTCMMLAASFLVDLFWHMHLLA